MGLSPKDLKTEDYVQGACSRNMNSDLRYERYD